MQSCLHVCSYDVYGAGIAARRLHEAMLAEGIDSSLLVRVKETLVPGVRRVAEDASAFRRQKRLPAFFHSLLYRTRYCVYSAIAPSNPRLVDEVCAQASHVDVVILHWIPYFLSVADIEAIASRIDADILWYALDMSPFTGGCHYSWDCENYVDGCHDCPAAKLSPAGAPVRSNMARKLPLFESGRVRIIAPNHWVASQAQKLSAHRSRVPVVYIPISPETFSPRPHDETAGPDAHRLKLLYGYTNFESRRKGSAQFLDAMRALDGMLPQSGPSAGRKPVVLLPNDGSDRRLADKLPFEVRWLGRATTDAELAELYRAADCFVSTSLEDSGPMMVSESLMAGCPVVSFDLGVARELIRCGENGFVVRKEDCDALASSLASLATMPANARLAMRHAARQSVLERASPGAALNALRQALTVSADSLR